MANRIREWLYRRYVKTLPPFAQRAPEMVDEYFQKHYQRGFRPLSSSDRREFEYALNRAALANLSILFGKERGE